MTYFISSIIRDCAATPNEPSQEKKCNWEALTLITDLVIVLLAASVAVLSLHLALGGHFSGLPQAFTHALGTIPDYGRWILFAGAGSILLTDLITFAINRCSPAKAVVPNKGQTNPTPTGETPQTGTSKEGTPPTKTKTTEPEPAPAYVPALSKEDFAPGEANAAEVEKQKEQKREAKLYVVDSNNYDMSRINLTKMMELYKNATRFTGFDFDSFEKEFNQFKKMIQESQDQFLSPQGLEKLKKQGDKVRKFVESINSYYLKPPPQRLTSSLPLTASVVGVSAFDALFMAS